jgi:transcriptional antiterminator RfaH
LGDVVLQVSGVISQDGRFDLPAAPWIAVNTHPHREHFALSNLQRQEFTTYCPMIRRRRAHARRVTMVLRPLFPNYLFVQAGPEFGRWQPILSTYWVRTVVRAGEKLSFIDDAFIAGLKRREIDGAIVRPERPFRIGEDVMIHSGPLDGLAAKVIELNEKDRLVVLLRLMNSEIKVKLSSACVRAT